MIPVYECLRGYALFLSLDRDRDAVFVGPTHKKDVCSAKPLVADKDVCREVSAGKVAEVDRPVRIRKGSSDENAFIRVRLRQEILL